MKNECLKQANIFANWLEMNDKQIKDAIVTITLKNDEIYKIMSDGSIVLVSSDTNQEKAFANANEAIASLESKNMHSLHDAIFEIQLPYETAKHVDDRYMALVKVKDNVAFLTYYGSNAEEPETIAVDIMNKYGVKPYAIIKK